MFTPTKIKHTSIFFLLLFASLLIVLYIFKHLVGIENLIRSFGIIGPIATILLYGLLSISPIPTDPLSVICGAIYGPLWGSMVSWLGNNLAALVEYYIGRHLGKTSDFTSQKSKLPFGLAKLPADSPYLLIFGRMIPQYGGKVISILAGLYHVPLRRYIWTTSLSNLIGSIAYALSGFGLVHLL